MEDALYYESHVTLDLFDPARYGELNTLCLAHGFGTADLTKKSTSTICTSKGMELNKLKESSTNLMGALKASDFRVTRFKIEKVILDERT